MGYALVQNGTVAFTAHSASELSKYMHDTNGLAVSLPENPAGLVVGPYEVKAVNYLSGIPAGTVGTGGFSYVVNGNVVERHESNRPMTLAEAQTAKLAELQSARDVAVVADVTVGATVYPADEKFKTYIGRILNQTGRGKPLPAGDLIRAKDRSKHTVTAALLSQIEDAIAAQEASAWTKFNGLADQVLNAATVAAVQAVVW